MPVAAIYARYSTDEQRPTSIEDQVRRCRETATKEKLVIEDTWVFSDSAISGTAKGRAKRVAYQRMMDAVENKLVDIVFIDDVSRAARDMLEGAKIMALVDSIGLRVVTSDGIDTAQPNWKMLWSFKLMTAVQQVENTASQVVRGMVGQLERGYQIAQPPFGYKGARIRDQSGRELGTVWEIDEKESALLRTMYGWRQSGKSVARIALELNKLEVLPPCYRRCSGVPYWRPATVHRMLGNPVYKGIFVWNGSGFSKAKAKKKRRQLVEQEFERPSLRIVSDELWSACNLPVRNRVVRGGGRHALAGVLTCGVCQALLSLKSVKRSCSVHCPQCEQANRVGGHQNFIGYSSLAAASQALQWCLREVFTGDVLAEFHARLQARVVAGPAREEADLRRRLTELEVALLRLKRLALDPDIGEELFRKDMTDARVEQKSKLAQLDSLLKRSSHVTKAAVDAQSSIDPLALIQKLIEGEPEAYKVRATLRRLISRFELVGKPARNVSAFELAFIPGVGVAEVCASEVIDDSSVTFRVSVSTTAARPVKWVVHGERI
jgi:DNA invertase Pin-like site-specific DNA recombinase